LAACLLTALLSTLAAAVQAAGFEESAWPRTMDSLRGKIVMYEPEVEAFTDDKLSGRAALSILPPGYTDPVFGAAWFEARVRTNRPAGTVEVLEVTVSRAKFPDGGPTREQDLIRVMQAQMSNWHLTLRLD